MRDDSRIAVLQREEEEEEKEASFASVHMTRRPTFWRVFLYIVASGVLVLGIAQAACVFVDWMITEGSRSYLAIGILVALVAVASGVVGIVGTVKAHRRSVKIWAIVHWTAALVMVALAIAAIAVGKGGVTLPIVCSLSIVQIAFSVLFSFLLSIPNLSKAKCCS